MPPPGIRDPHTIKQKAAWASVLVQALLKEAKPLTPPAIKP